MCFWDEEDAVLADPSKSSSAFYLRVKAGGQEAVKAVIPGGRVLEIPERDGDFAYFTPVLEEGVFDEICEGLGDLVLGRIRLDA